MTSYLGEYEKLRVIVEPDVYTEVLRVRPDLADSVFTFTKEESSRCAQHASGLMLLQQQQE